MAYGIFWLNERIIDSHNVDLSMLDTVYQLAHDPDQIRKIADERTHCGGPVSDVSDSDRSPTRG